MRTTRILFVGIAALVALAGLLRHDPDRDKAVVKTASGRVEVKHARVDVKPERVEVKRTDSPLPPPESRRLEGRVIDEEGRPVPHALVSWYRPDKEPGSIETDDDGLFVIENATSTPWWIRARQGVRVSRHINVDPVSTNPVVVRLQRGPRLEVTVATDDDRPIAGALVTSDDLTARSDARGIATLDGVRTTRGGGSVRVFADGFADGSTWTSGNRRIRVRLSRGTTIHGKVLGPTGPVANAVVVGDELGDSNNGWGRAARTDESGRWTMTLPTGKPYSVSASARGVISDGNRVIDTANTEEIVIRVKRGRVISGVVVTAEGTPAVGAQVRTYGTTFDETITNADGEFVFYTTHEPLQVRATLGNDVASANGSVGMKMQLTRPTMMVHGVIVDDVGEPMGGMQVNVGFAQGMTGANGEFEVGPLPAHEYDMAVLGSTDEVEHRTHGSPGTHHRIVIARGSAITGRVFLDGHPLADYCVANGESPYDPPRGGTGVHDPSGRFSLQMRGTGARKIAFESETAKSRIVELTIAPGAAIDVGTIELERAAMITGHVVDAERRAVAHATVSLDSGNACRGLRVTETDEHGQFTIANPSSARPPTILARHRENYASMTLGADDVVLQLRATGIVAGRARPESTIRVGEREMTVTDRGFWLRVPAGTHDAVQSIMGDVPYTTEPLTYRTPIATRRVTVRPNETTIVDFDP